MTSSRQVSITCRLERENIPHVIRLKAGERSDVYYLHMVFVWKLGGLCVPSHVWRILNKYKGELTEQLVFELLVRLRSCHNPSVIANVVAEVPYGKFQFSYTTVMDYNSINVKLHTENIAK